MDAVRLERLTGLATGGRFHTKKLLDYRRALIKLWKKKSEVSENDKQIIKELLIDIQNALSSN